MIKLHALTGVVAHGRHDIAHEVSVIFRVVSRVPLDQLEDEGTEHGVRDKREDEHYMREKRPQEFHRCPSGCRARATLCHGHGHLLALGVYVLYMSACRRVTGAGLPD